MKLHIVIDDVVKNFATDIIVSAKEYNPDIDIDISFYECMNDSQTQVAHQAIITSDIGIITIFPDFAKKSAQATIIRVGELKRLIAEGFDDEFIDAEGKVYGDLLDYNEKHVKMFGYYLTHKL